jgi:acetyl-CoA carboxylase biotin carboxyl carrier protein
VELDHIKEIIGLMKQNDLREFELENGDFKVRIKRGGVETPQAAPSIVVSAPAPVAPAPVPAAVPAPAPAAPPANTKDIISPMVGTFYLAPAPDQPPFVKVGDKVEPNSVVCIIEAMKVMNEIKADVKGIITEVLVENGKPVEFGQPLFRVQVA